MPPWVTKAATTGDGDDGGGDDGGEPQAGSSGGGGGGRQERASDAADLDFEPGELSGGERALLAAARRLMEAGAGVVKAMGRALLTGGVLRLHLRPCFHGVSIRGA